MKVYTVSFETHDVTWQHTFSAKGRIAAENVAESLIEERFFKDSKIRHYFYTLVEDGEGKRRVIRACNAIAPNIVI
jgi:hypothetical protein